MLLIISLLVKRHETQTLWMEVELDFTSRSVTMFRQDEVSDVLAIGFRVVIVFTIDKSHDVGVLLDRAGFAEVGELRDLWVA